MAQEANQTATSEPKARPKVQVWQLGLGGLCLLLAGALFLPSLAVLAVCLAPTVVAFLADRSRPKFLTMTVGLPNLCGSIPTLVQLWSIEQSFGAMAGVLADPLGWAVPFGSAGLGWLLYMAMPPVVAVYYSSASEARKRALKRLQTALVETWGEDVAGEHADAVQPSNTPDIEAA